MFKSVGMASDRCGEVVFIGACHLATCTRPGFDSPRRYIIFVAKGRVEAHRL
jgi:hypothetical protein